MNPVDLFVPESLRHAEPRRRGASDFAAFERDLAEALRPRLVVVLGVGTGWALSALCQAMRDHHVDGLVYGIDPFTDDDGKAADDETRWESLNNFLHTHYRGSTYLLRSPPEDTLRHFADGAVNLLVVDASRFATPLEGLVSSWAEKVAPGGVLLTVAESPRLPAEWCPPVPIAGATIRFASRRASPVTPPDESPLLRTLGSAEASDRRSVASFYEHVFLHHTLRAEIEEHRVDLHRKKAGA